MDAEEAKELIADINRLEWTEEIRLGHPWQGELLLNKAQVVALIEEAAE